MKKLEEKIPELQAKLRSHMKQAPARAGSSGADGLTRRVEALEESVDTLLDAQVCLSALSPHSAGGPVHGSDCRMTAVHETHPCTSSHPARARACAA